jgi:hypothetical protein
LSQQRRRQATRRRSGRRRIGAFLVTTVVAAFAIFSGAVLLIGKMQAGGVDPVADFAAKIPSSKAAARLEQARQQMILTASAAKTLSIVSSPKLASRPQPASSPGTSTDTTTTTTTTTTTVPSAPPDPGTAQSTAYNMMSSFGFNPKTEFGCLNDIWTRESGWRYNAENASGAYGIPQALPGSKMASAGSDWLTNPATQIKWGLGYIKGTYGTPCDAWSFWQAHGWY